MLPTTNCEIMTKKIKDQHTEARVSRQRKHQMRQNEKGLCQLCNNPRSGTKKFCEECLERYRVLGRLRRLDRMRRGELGI